MAEAGARRSRPAAGRQPEEPEAHQQRESDDRSVLGRLRATPSRSRRREDRHHRDDSTVPSAISDDEEADRSVQEPLGRPACADRAVRDRAARRDRDDRDECDDRRGDPSVPRVDPPGRRALASMPDGTNDRDGTLAPADGDGRRERHAGQLLRRRSVRLSGAGGRGGAADAGGRRRRRRRRRRVDASGRGARLARRGAPPRPPGARAAGRPSGVRRHVARGGRAPLARARRRAWSTT